MHSSRFDAIIRSLAPSRSRRSLLSAIGGYATSVLASSPSAAAKCKRIGKHCKRNKDCCQGARCKGGKCRCAGGRDVCGQACCAECFVEANTSETMPPIPIPGTEFCCAAASVCDSGTGDPSDDFCCRPEEACIDGDCCCDGCEGTVVCGGVCCPSVSCCNGACCGPGQVCATQEGGGRACVEASRACTPTNICFDGEMCRGGICCAGDRACFDSGPGTNPICCPLGEYCDPSGNCCPNGVPCATGKKVRIRP